LLSDQRADAVKYYLVANGIAPERISTVGFGETQPRASNDTPEGRAQNRRVEFTVTSQDICQPQGSQSEGEEVTAP
jgi:outer membrane protein OmpA-like peptidoglycan-associated protein